MKTPALHCDERGCFELRFQSLLDPGRAYAFPCDAAGRVDMDALGERTRNSYLYARTVVGREFSMPQVHSSMARHGRPFRIRKQGRRSRHGCIRRIGSAGRTHFEFYPAEEATRYAAQERCIMESGVPMVNHEEHVRYTTRGGRGSGPRDQPQACGSDGWKARREKHPRRGQCVFFRVVAACQGNLMCRDLSARGSRNRTVVNQAIA
jgi:hypothetical protein